MSFKQMVDHSATFNVNEDFQSKTFETIQIELGEYHQGRWLDPDHKLQSFDYNVKLRYPRKYCTHKFMKLTIKKKGGGEPIIVDSRTIHTKFVNEHGITAYQPGNEFAVKFVDENGTTTLPRKDNKEPLHLCIACRTHKFDGKFELPRINLENHGDLEDSDDILFLDALTDYLYYLTTYGMDDRDRLASHKPNLDFIVGETLDHYYNALVPKRLGSGTEEKEDVEESDACSEQKHNDEQQFGLVSRTQEATVDEMTVATSKRGGKYDHYNFSWTVLKTPTLKDSPVTKKRKEDSLKASSSSGAANPAGTSPRGMPPQLPQAAIDEALSKKAGLSNGDISLPPIPDVIFLEPKSETNNTSDNKATVTTPTIRSESLEKAQPKSSPHRKRAKGAKVEALIRTFEGHHL